MSIFTGSGVAIVTPFDENGVNLDAFGKLIDFQIEQGTDAIVVCGTTGEPSTMTTKEKETAIAFAIERVGGRVPVVAGTGGNNTAAVIEASKRAQTLGAGNADVLPLNLHVDPQACRDHIKRSFA